MVHSIKFSPGWGPHFVASCYGNHQLLSFRNQVLRDVWIVALVSWEDLTRVEGSFLRSFEVAATQQPNSGWVGWMCTLVAD